MLKRPPTHSLDREMLFVDIEDPAWELDRVQQEQKKMEEANEDPAAHPIVRYFSGRSRYDLDASAMVLGESRCPRDYLGDDPRIFTLRRLGYQEFRRVRTLTRKSPEEAAVYALTEGVSLIEGPGFENFKPPVGPRELEKLHTIDTDLIDRVAGAAVNGSAPPTDEELKR